MNCRFFYVHNITIFVVELIYSLKLALTIDTGKPPAAPFVYEYGETKYPILKLDACGSTLPVKKQKHFNYYI